MPVTSCMICNSIFNISDREFERGRGKYCSKKCRIESTRKREFVKCKICDQKYETRSYKLKNGKGVYCSRSCANKGRVTSIRCKCLGCDNDFSVSKSEKERGRGKYCSKECYLKNVPKVDRNCINCHNNFVDKPSGNKKYCSRKCYEDHRKMVGTIESTCKYCKNKFYARLSKVLKGAGKFCSISCFRLSKKNVEMKCKTCKKSFITNKHNADNGRKYCSKACTGKNFEKVDCVCLECGDLFKTRLSYVKSGGGKYCSVKCFNKSRTERVVCQCNYCNKPMERINSTFYDTVFCSKECYGKSRFKQVLKACERCGNEFYVRPSILKTKGNGRFCSKDCSLKSCKPTGIEISIGLELKKLLLNYESQKKFGRWWADFFVIDMNLVIECDGDYWHNLPGAKERDQRKDDWFRKNGYNIIRIPEHEINIDPEEALMSRLAPFL
jgi:hypothetical protein